MSYVHTRWTYWKTQNYSKRPRGQARRAWPRRAKRVGGWVSENDSIVRVCSPITIPEIPFCLLCSPKLWHINKKISKNSWKRNMAFVYFFCLHGAKVLVSLAERQKRNKQKTNTLAPWRHAIAKISFSLKNSQNWLFLGSNRGFGSTKIFIILVTYLVVILRTKGQKKSSWKLFSTTNEGYHHWHSRQNIPFTRIPFNFCEAHQSMDLKPSEARTKLWRLDGQMKFSVPFHRLVLVNVI